MALGDDAVRTRQHVTNVEWGAQQVDVTRPRRAHRAALLCPEEIAGPLAGWGRQPRLPAPTARPTSSLEKHKRHVPKARPARKRDRSP